MYLKSTLKIKINDSASTLGQNAGYSAAEKIKSAISQNGFANIILATGTSQYETLNYLVGDPTIDWTKVTLFHLDEYIGIPVTHKASFRKYLTERFLSKVPALHSVHLIAADGDIDEVINYLSHQIITHPIDVALIGIGENGHLAFNDPPADFETEAPYLVVTLDEACRQQQVNEDWFDTIELVPKQAISMSIRQILKSKHIICSIPDLRKANAVCNSLQMEIHPSVPATILQSHPSCEIYLDEASASLLNSTDYSWYPVG